MVEQGPLKHHIQKHIIEVLLFKKIARFSELRPKNTDTNLFTYHLKCLMRDGFIEKTNGGYTLSSSGLVYVDRLSTLTGTIRHQPKIITMLLVQNSDGQVLLQKRTKQPYIDAWTLPYGKMHIDDESVEAAAIRETEDKLMLKIQHLRHVGDCYIRVFNGKEVLSTTLAHIIRFETDAPLPKDTLWVEPLDLRKYTLAPAVEEIVGCGFISKDYFFTEFNCQWKG